nr:hypothetical protein GCM10025732_58040 [Glycomyces mayteni]
MLGAFEAEHRLVAQRGHAGGLGEPAREGPLGDARGRGEVGQAQRLGVPHVDEVLDAVHGVGEVRAVPQHRRVLRGVAAAPRVDDHLAGDLRGRGGAVPHGDQVQRQVDAAGDPR